jgi:hypothetical protein
MASANGNGGRKVTSLRDLPRAIDPSRDLWSGIESQIAAGARAGRITGVAWARYSRLRWVAAAAAIASLAVGMWIGRSFLPVPGQATGSGTVASTATRSPQALQAAYITDPRYTKEREALVKSLEAQLASLPPASRDKVMRSLATIHKSIQDLQEALGRDPSNALLQELLVNTYQDEMRVLTVVHEASQAGKGI